MEQVIERNGQRGRPRTVVQVSGGGVVVSALGAALLSELHQADTAQASNTALAARLKVSKNSVVRALAELESAGLVERKYTSRARSIELTTPQGAVSAGFHPLAGTVKRVRRRKKVTQ